MHAVFAPAQAADLLPKDADPVRVVIAYDGVRAGQHAMKVYDHLIQAIGADLSFHNTLVSFTLLTEPRFREQSASAIEAADLLIISTIGTAAPPEPVRRWIEDWLATRATDDAALVGMTEASADEDSSEFHTYLESVANRARITYLRGTIPGSKTVAASLESVPRWGINE